MAKFPSTLRPNLAGQWFPFTPPGWDPDADPRPLVGGRICANRFGGWVQVTDVVVIEGEINVQVKPLSVRPRS